MKKYILGIVTGLLISGTVVIAANYLYKADEVSYTPKDTEWNVNNVEGAINDLYDKANNKPSGSKSITTNGTYDVSKYASAIVNIPKTSLEGDVKVVWDCVDRWNSSWITVDSWSKYRGFVVVAYAGNGVGGISYGTIDSNGGITYTSKSSYTSVEVSGNKIRGGEGIMSNVGVFLMIY